MIERVLRRGMGDPGPGPDRPARTDLDELGIQRFTRLGVVLQRRAQHPVSAPVSQDATVAQAGKERTDDRARRARVGILERHLDVRQLGRAHDPAARSITNCSFAQR